MEGGDQSLTASGTAPTSTTFDRKVLWASDFKLILKLDKNNHLILHQYF